jgi:hypothetical protein
VGVAAGSVEPSTLPQSTANEFCGAEISYTRRPTEDDMPLGVAGLELHAESSFRTSTTPAGGPEAPACSICLNDELRGQHREPGMTRLALPQRIGNGIGCRRGRCIGSSVRGTLRKPERDGEQDKSGK